MEEVPVDLFLWLQGLGNWADRKDEDIGDIFSRFVELLGGPVSLNLGNVSGNLRPVGQEVLSEFRDELNWVGEDSGPSLNLVNITLDILALIEVIWELLDDLSNFLDGLNDVLEISLGDVRDCVGDLSLEGLSVGEALLDLRKVILIKHSHEESSNELLSSFEGHGVVGGEDGCSSLNESHSVFKLK